MNQALYSKLTEVARQEQTITYGEIAPLLDLNMENPYDRNKMANLLGEISTHEHSEGRPMLSAIVVLAEKGIPGDGFFILARNLGKHQGRNDFGDMDFFVQEAKKVFAYWNNH